MTFQQIECSNAWSTIDFLKIADFVFLMKPQVTRKRVNLHGSFCMNYVRASVRKSLQYSFF